MQLVLPVWWLVVIQCSAASLVHTMSTMQLPAEELQLDWIAARFSSSFFSLPQSTIETKFKSCAATVLPESSCFDIDRHFFKLMTIGDRKMERLSLKKKKERTLFVLE